MLGLATQLSMTRFSFTSHRTLSELLLFWAPPWSSKLSLPRSLKRRALLYRVLPVVQAPFSWKPLEGCFWASLRVQGEAQ